MFPSPVLQKHETAPTADDVVMAASLTSKEAASGTSAGAEKVFAAVPSHCITKPTCLGFLVQGRFFWFHEFCFSFSPWKFLFKKGKEDESCFFCLVSKQFSVAEVPHKWIPHRSLYRLTTVDEINKGEQYKNRNWR